MTRVRMQGGHSPPMVQIRFVGTDGETWTTDRGQYWVPYDFGAVFQCVNPTVSERDGVFCDYKSTRPINGNDLYLTHKTHGNTHGWAMFATKSGTHWDRYGYIGVEVGHPTENGEWISGTGDRQFPLATAWYDRKNGHIDVEMSSL